MTKVVHKDIYSSFNSIYKMTKYLGLLIMEFDQKRNFFYVTKKNHLISSFFSFTISALEIGIFINRLIGLESNSLFINILSVLESSFSFLVSYLNFYFYKTKCINIFQKIHKFDTKTFYKPIYNYKIKRYRMFSILNFILYLSVDIICYFFKMFPIEVTHIVIISLISFVINSATRIIYIFFITEIENRFIFIDSSPTLRFYKHITILTDMSKPVNSIYNFPLISSAAQICVSLTMTLSYMFFQISRNNFNFISLFLPTFRLLVGTCEVGVIIFICEKFYNTVSTLYLNFHLIINFVQVENIISKRKKTKNCYKQVLI